MNTRDHRHGAAGVDQTVGTAPTASGHYVNRGFADRFLLGQVEFGLRYVRGRIDTTSVAVNSGPTILQGSGFSVVRSAAGIVVLTFATSFGELPSIWGGAETTAKNAAGAHVASLVSRGSFIARRWETVNPDTIDETQRDTDGIMTFLALGKP